MKKVLVLSQAFPPQVGGSATLMRNLFKDFPPDQYVVISGPAGGKHQDVREQLDAPLYHVGYPRQLHRFLYRFEFVMVPFILFAARKILKTHKVDLIFANYPSASFLIAAYYLSRQTKLPLHTYLHDFWRDTVPLWQDRVLARVFEARILRASKQVFVITDEAGKYLHQKYGISTATLLHPVDTELMHPYAEDKVDEPATILFTGYIYELMNLDAIRSLAQAVNSWGRNVKLVLVTSSDPQYLRRAGIDGPAVDIRSPVSRKETIEMQRRATILYLPLAFHSRSPLEIQTVFPVKATDYFVAGRPILVHAPTDSHIARYAREKGWGLVVSDSAPNDIQSAIGQLLDNPQLCKALVAAAQQCASKRDIRTVSSWLQDKLFST